MFDDDTSDQDLSRVHDEAHKNLKQLFDCLFTFWNGENGKKCRALFKAVGLGDKYSKLVDLQHLAEDLQHPAENSQHPAENSQLVEMHKRVQEAKMTIAFLGHSSAGKSTILNCLMRRDLLPFSPGHTTPCPTIIMSTDRGKSSYETTSGRKGVLSNLRHKEKGKMKKNGRENEENEEEKEEDEGEGGGGEEDRDFDLSSFSSLDSKDTLQLFLSHSYCKDTVLKINSLKLVDYPGWNSDMFDETCSELKKADAIVFVMNSEAGSDDKDMKNHLLRLKESERSSENSVFLVFNKLDEFLKKNDTNENSSESLQEKHFQDAEKILVTDSNFFQSKSDARKATHMFSATDAALMRNTDEISSLAQSLRIEEEEGKVGKVVICGSQGVGKTSLCNELLRSSLLPVSPDSARCWVICYPPVDVQACTQVAIVGNQPEPLTDNQSLHSFLKKSKENVLTVYPASHLVNDASILKRCEELVDSPSSENRKFASCSRYLGNAHSVIIVASCKTLADETDIETQLFDNLQLIDMERRNMRTKGDSNKDNANENPNQRIFLVVNMWDDERKKNNHENDPDKVLQRKKKVRETFADGAIELQSREKSMHQVFFISVKDLGKKQQCASGFHQFEKHLFQSAKTNYTELPIQNLKREIVKVHKHLQKLWLELRKIKETCATLKEFKTAIGDSSIERKNFVSLFLAKYEKSDAECFSNDAYEDDTSVQSFQMSRLCLLPAKENMESHEDETSINTFSTDSRASLLSSPNSEDNTSKPQPFVPKTTEQKEEMMNKFFNSLLENTFKEKTSSNGDSLVTRNVLKNFQDSPEVHGFLRSLCEQAEAKLPNRLRGMDEAKLVKIMKKARLNHRGLSRLKLSIGFGGVGTAAGAGTGTALVASEAAVGAMGAVGAAAVGAVAFGVLAGVTGAAVVGAGIAYTVACHTWPDFKDKESVQKFLETYMDVWLFTYAEFFDKELQKLVQEKAASIKEADRIQPLIDELKKNFRTLKKKVPETAEHEARDGRFQLVV